MMNYSYTKLAIIKIPQCNFEKSENRRVATLSLWNSRRIQPSWVRWAENSRAASLRDSSRRSLSFGGEVHRCALVRRTRRYSSSAKWPLIAMMVKYRRGISSVREGCTRKGWPASAPRRYYFVGRLTNDYAGATFAKTKKTLSLNHKEPLPEARTRRI